MGDWRCRVEIVEKALVPEYEAKAGDQTTVEKVKEIMNKEQSVQDALKALKKYDVEAPKQIATLENDGEPEEDSSEDVIKPRTARLTTGSVTRRLMQCEARGHA